MNKKAEVTKKISKKNVNEYRKWAKLAIFLRKMLVLVEGKKKVLEDEFLEITKASGASITDGMVCEAQEYAGHTGVSYKAAYLFAYDMLPKGKKALADEFLESVTSEPESTTRLVITDTQITFYATELRKKEVDVESLINVME